MWPGSQLSSRFRLPMTIKVPLLDQTQQSARILIQLAFNPDHIPGVNL